MTGSTAIMPKRSSDSVSFTPTVISRAFYSDSYSDEPLALLADKAYIVKGEELIDWDYNQHKKNLRT